MIIRITGYPYKFGQVPGQLLKKLTALLQRIYYFRKCNKFNEQDMSLRDSFTKWQLQACADSADKFELATQGSCRQEYK